jgi:RsiW-degrading membrane proteinase PrsW (M82 family)
MAAMNKHNWPFLTDLGDSNWTGRTNRTMRCQTRYTRADERIPPIAWVVGLALLGVVFGLVPFMAWVMQ